VFKMLWSALLSLSLLLATAFPVQAAPDYLSFKTEDEANSIEIFKKASRSVVFVTNTAYRRDVWSFNVQEIPRGSGTGFVWNKQGIIVTNYHVIQGANKVTITLQDQSSWDAEVVGLAPEKDLAVLRIAAPKSQLYPLPIGDSSQLEVGRKVLAIGNPFGLDTTLTVGVISALGREIDAVGGRKISGVIQTDAAINPGNSGGPLLNSLGQLAGVNTAIYSPSGASAGIGFAIPVNTVKKIVPQLITYGRVIRPILGVELVPDNWLRRQGIEGIAILRVTPGYPAHKAGLQGVSRGRRGSWRWGDIITAIDGKAVNGQEQLLDILEERRAGDEVELTVLRGKETLEIELELVSGG